MPSHHALLRKGGICPSNRSDRRKAGRVAGADIQAFFQKGCVVWGGVDFTQVSDDDYFEEEEDESIIDPTLLNIGGILDHSELSKINNILREDVIQNEINLEKSDWKDIAAIIDDALDEVKEYEFDLTQTPTKPYNLVLSNFHINELRPLLEKFDQTVIDKLSSGETVNVKMSLKEK